MNIILSIKPEYVEKIFSGEKKYEYRKIIFKQKVDTAYIYASSPIRKIVGEFRIERIICDAPETIWRQTKEQSGVSKIFFEKYYKGRSKGVALKIMNCKEYDNWINPKLLIPDFKAPQSFIYVNTSKIYEISQGL